MKFPVKCFLFLTILLAAIGAAVVTVKAAEEKYTLGYYTTAGAGEDSQLKVIFSDILEIFHQREKIDIQLKTFSDPGDLIKAVEKGEVDIVFGFEYDIIFTMLNRFKFHPATTYSVFKKGQDRYCVYVKKNSRFKSMKELKDAKMVIAGKSKFSYYLLRKMAGEPPEKMFLLQSSRNESSILYALALDQVDSAFVNDMHIEYFKMANPGPVKDIRQLECANNFFNYPIMYSSKVPESVWKLVQQYLSGIRKEEALKKYLPLLRMTNISFHPITAEDYEPEMALYREATEKSWDKDFDKLQNYIEKK